MKNQAEPVARMYHPDGITPMTNEEIMEYNRRFIASPIMMRMIVDRVIELTKEKEEKAKQHGRNRL
jgi:hypothetical protein